MTDDREVEVTVQLLSQHSGAPVRLWCGDGDGPGPELVAGSFSLPWKLDTEPAPLPN